MLQPLDVAVFRPVKGTWRTVVHNFRLENNYAKLTRQEFSKTVQKCFDQCLKPDTIKSRFQCCGIFPFDPQNINYDKLLEKSNKHASKAQAPVIATSSEATKNELFKKEFESRLSHVTLSAFQNTEDEWTGDLQYKKLFSFWKNITSCDAINQPLEIGDRTLTNNIDEDNVSELVMNYQVGDDDRLIPDIGMEVDILADPLLVEIPISIPLIQEISDNMGTSEYLHDPAMTSLQLKITQDTQKSLPAISSERQESLTSATNSPTVSLVLTSANKCSSKVEISSSRPVPSLIPLPSNVPQNLANICNKKQKLLEKQSLNPCKRDTSEPSKTSTQSSTLPKKQKLADVLISPMKLPTLGVSSCAKVCDEQDFLRSSTPRTDQALSPVPMPSISDIEGSDDELIFNVKQSHLCKRVTEPNRKSPALGVSFCDKICDEQDLLRSSTPQTDKILNLKLVRSISDIEGSDDQLIFNVKSSQLQKKAITSGKKKSHHNHETSSEMNTAKSSVTDNKSILNEKDASSETFVPTPFKQIPTPFKNAFYFPKKEEKSFKKKVYKKVSKFFFFSAACSSSDRTCIRLLQFLQINYTPKIISIYTKAKSYLE